MSPRSRKRPGARSRARARRPAAPPSASRALEFLRTADDGARVWRTEEFANGYWAAVVVHGPAMARFRPFCDVSIWAGDDLVDSPMLPDEGPWTSYECDTPEDVDRVIASVEALPARGDR